MNLKVYTFWGTESYEGKSLDIRAYDCLFGFEGQKLAEIFKTVEKKDAYHWRIFSAGNISPNLYGLTGCCKTMKAARAAIIDVLHLNGYKKLNDKALVMK